MKFDHQTVSTLGIFGIALAGAGVTFLLPAGNVQTFGYMAIGLCAAVFFVILSQQSRKNKND